MLQCQWYFFKPLVTYTRSLKDAKEDDASKKAIKVYALTQVITDVVDLGGGQFCIIDRLSC